jgi:ribonuclease D
MKFYKKITALLDLQGYYKEVTGKKEIVSLSRVVKEFLNKDLCKAERMSRWTNRPMRQT